MMKTNIILIIAAALLVAPAFALQTPAGLPGPDTTGINPATGETWKHCDSYRLAFLSSVPHDGVSGDIDVYNTFVQGLADANGLDGVVWNVIGSTETVDARDNTMTNPESSGGHEGPIYLVDGTTLVAYNHADLWDGEYTGSGQDNVGGVQHIIDQTEVGDTLTGWPWTGTALDGTAGGYPLGNDGDVQQGQSGDATRWIWRQWTHKPAANENLLYAMSEPLYVTDSTLDFVNKPTIQAGPDLISWLDEPTPMDPNITNADTSKTLTYQWTANADPNLVVTFDSSIVEAPIVTISQVAGEEVSYPATVEIELAVNYEETANTVSDVTHSMSIDVYADACTAAQSVGEVTLDKSDLNEDCVTDVDDIAIFAQNWLQGDGLTSPQPK